MDVLWACAQAGPTLPPQSKNCLNQSLPGSFTSTDPAPSPSYQTFPGEMLTLLKTRALALNRSGPSACEQQGLCQPGWEAAVLVLRGAGAGAAGG